MYGFAKSKDSFKPVPPAFRLSGNNCPWLRASTKLSGFNGTLDYFGGLGAISLALDELACLPDFRPCINLAIFVYIVGHGKRIRSFVESYVTVVSYPG